VKHKTAKANVRTRTRLFSLLLAVLMMLFCFPVTAIGADGVEEPISETLEETADAGLSAFERGVGELSPEALESMTLNAADVPEVISAQAIAEKDHVLRLREQEENLNTVVFQNRDGGKTVYLYANPVKYVDANRNVKDKSTALKAENITLNGKTYSHSATENVFGQYYPTMPQNGVLITFGQYTVEMTPVITGILTLRDTAVANNKVTYNKVFGNGTSLVYTPTLSGVKEDIILQTYMGKSSFSFTLKTNGLAIVQTESDTFLADFEGNKVASLGKVVITDRANHTAYGSMTVAAKTEREEYTVTINAPVEFLTSSATVYPVTVDPTFVINETYESGLDDYGNAQYSTAIEDLCVYDGTSDPLYADIATIGNYSGNYKSAMLYRIKADAWSGMNLDAYVNNIRFGGAALNIEVGALTSNIGVAVSPSSASWTSGLSQNVESVFMDYDVDSNSNVTSLYRNTVVNNNDIAVVNITNIMDYWADNPALINYGMILYVNNDYEVTTPQSSFNIYQLEESSSNVYITIDYGELNGSFFINSCNSGKFLTGSGGTSVTQATKQSVTTFQSWTFIYKGSNQYYIALSENTSRLLCMDDNFSVSICEEGDMNSDNYTWYLNFDIDRVSIFNVAMDEYLYSPASGSTLGNSMAEEDSWWQVCKTSSYVPLTSFKIADIFVDINEDIIPSIYDKYPSNATFASVNDFMFTSSNDSIAKVSSDGSIIGMSNDCCNITATHKISGVAYNFYVTVGQLFKDGKYYIENKGSGLSLSCSSQATNALLSETNSSNRQKWILTYVEDGYYLAEIVVGGAVNSSDANEYRLCVFDSNTTTSATIGFQNTDLIDSNIVTSNQLWKLIYTKGGNIKIVAKSSESSGMYLKANSSTANSACIQGTYSRDSNYFDEWNIVAIADAFLLGVRDYPEDIDPDANPIYNRYQLLLDDVKPDLNAISLNNFEVYYGSEYITYDKKGNVEHPEHEDMLPMDSSTFCQKASEASIVVFSGHGSQNSINLGKSRAVDISGLPDDYFSKTDIIVLLSCSCGSGRENSDNFVNELHSKGAETVVGFDKVIKHGGVTEWLPVFIDRLVAGASVEQAATDANTHTYNVLSNEDTPESMKEACETIYNSYYIAGNKNNTIFD